MALPRIETDVVVVSAGTYERRLGAHSLDEVEPEYVAVESQRTIEVGHLEVYVANLHSRVNWSGCVHMTLRHVVRKIGHDSAAIARRRALSRSGDVQLSNQQDTTKAATRDRPCGMVSQLGSRRQSSDVLSPVPYSSRNATVGAS